MRARSASTALLVMDVQRGIAARLDDGGAAVVARVAAAVEVARTAGLRVVFVRVGFRPGHPEVSPRNRAFAALRDAGGLADEAATAIDPRAAPRPDEAVVTKRRVSAFAGSDLEVVLRAGAVEDLVLCGIATGGVVLSTLRAAADLDFGLTVLHDACADADDEVHRVLTTKVFPRQADVLDVATWTERLDGAAGDAAVVPELSVRGGRAAIDFYRAAFGAAIDYRVGGTDEHEAVVAQLSVGGATFWVADESPAQRNFSPETLGGGTVRLLLIVADPDAVAARAVAAGATEVVPGGRRARLAPGPPGGPLRPPLGGRAPPRSRPPPGGGPDG